MKWLAGGGQNQKQAEQEFFHLLELGLVKGEILALLVFELARDAHLTSPRYSR